MDELPIHKLIVDSRNAISGTASDFQVQMPEALYLPQDACCYCTDVTISHTFRSVEGDASVEGRNHYLYFFERTYANGTQLVLNRATLRSGHYSPSSLANEIESQMNAVSFFGAHYTATYNVTVNSIQIALSYVHPIPTYVNTVGFALINEDVLADHDFQSYVSGMLEEGPQGTPYVIDFRNPESCSGVLGLARGSSANVKWPALKLNLINTMSKTQTTGSIDVRHKTSLYLHSNSLSNNRIVGPAGSRSVICRIPVTQLYGGVERRAHSSHPLDFIPVGGRTLSVLDFQVRDSFGNIVTLHGGHVSLELVFSKTSPIFLKIIYK